ncbi:ABC transporter ATP-binding protein [Cupriavidus agavae]|uniref:Putative ABC transport system ATP-binding protein n=1 Tax=Cupriavidus agavae TaxID=1001822 RepID=A0A4Q7RZ79_9BURK|nr:ABC transporter ATP-binding protein [Cupriavidus agavae]RZT38617.1 putative ABC transport system ATP-binding protein [Cupriavidus agavae]
MAIVQVRAVTKVYPLGDTTVNALDGVDLTVRAGDFLALTGPSGSGKSTLLNLICCLDLPTSGDVCIDGVRTTDLGEAALDQLRSRTIGMIFQSFNLIPVLNVQENVALPLHLHGMAASERRERVAEAIAAVGLTPFASSLPERLSGGQRQRVAIARALVTAPRLILADEPTASLDSANAFALIELMQSLNRDHGVTFLFSTHDDRLLRNVRDIVRLRDGRIETARRMPETELA